MNLISDLHKNSRVRICVKIKYLTKITAIPIQCLFNNPMSQYSTIRGLGSPYTELFSHFMNAVSHAMQLNLIEFAVCNFALNYSRQYALMIFIRLCTLRLSMLLRDNIFRNHYNSK